jgi:LysR family transcriptional regulator, hca operon transcriptional activator
MELRHLRYFMMVANEQSFTKAAQKLFTTQPSLSQQIKDLEQEVGVQLLDRSARQIRLTQEGQAFLPYAQAAIDNAHMAIASARQVAQQKHNQLYIGFLNVAEITLMPQLLAKLKQQMPQLNINIQSLTCLEQIQALKNAELDLAFTRYQIQDPHYGSHLILEEAVYLVASKKLYPHTQPISSIELQQKTLILCEQNASPVFYEKIQQYFNFEQLPTQQLMWVTNVLQHINLINMGLGFSFLPEYALKFLNADIVQVKTEFTLPQLALYANYRKDSANVALQWIVQELCQL